MHISDKSVYVHWVRIYDHGDLATARILHQFTTQCACVSQVWNLLAHLPREYYIEIESQLLVPWGKTRWSWWNRKGQANHPMAVNTFSASDKMLERLDDMVG